VGNATIRNRYAIAAQQFLGLVFMNIHVSFSACLR
jgi:hypothetical protein